MEDTAPMSPWRAKGMHIGQKNNCPAGVGVTGGHKTRWIGLPVAKKSRTCFELSTRPSFEVTSKMVEINCSFRMDFCAHCLADYIN